MANYILQFGATTYSGLAPVFTVFKAVPSGGNTTAPTITELPTSSGLYYFTYTPTGSVAFVVDGATTGIPATSRYIAGSLSPADDIDTRVGTTLAAMGTTLVASGNTLIATGTTLVGIGNSLAVMGTSLSLSFGTSLLAVIGTTASSFGSTATDPATVIGYLKRIMEFNEGNSAFTKSTGIWDVYARGNAVGASTQLVQKTVSDSGSVVSKV